MVVEPGTAILPNLIDVCTSFTHCMCLFMHVLVGVGGAKCSIECIASEQVN